MPPVIATGNHPKALWPGVKSIWGMEYDSHGEECRDLFDIDQSDKAYEEMFEATGFGLAPVKQEGGATTYDTHQQGAVTRATHAAVSLGYIVTREELDDNKYPQVSARRAKANAFSMHTTKETIAANVYNRAFNSSYTFGDGVQIISASHPTVAGNQSNALAVAADMSEASVEDMIIQIMQTENSRGLKIKLMPRCLIVPPSLHFEAHRILDSTLQNDTGNNAVNVLRSTGAIPEGVKVNHYLTDTDAWFVRTNAPEGMKGFIRTKIEFTQDNDFDTDNAKAKAYERYSFTMGDFRGIFGSEGA